MNRTTAILVALATLLAHVFAIHQNADGDFAPPHELAHAAYRVARQIVYEGTFAWNRGAEVTEAYPSFAWVIVCAVFERLYLSSTTWTQAVGIACALGTVVLLAQFSAGRLAGLIALLLLVVAGTTATAAVAGTEAAPAMLVATAAFLAHERRRRIALGAMLALFVLLRPEGLFFAAALLAADLVRRRPEHRRLLGAYLAPAAVVALGALVRRAATGHWNSPWGALVVDPDLERIELGAAYVGTYFTRSGAAILVAFPLVHLALRRLSPTGIVALWLTFVWAGLVLWTGGDGQPFWLALAPILPVLLVAVQEGMTRTMDTARPLLVTATWAVFCGGIVASGVLSRAPADLGPVPLRRLQLAWMQPPESLARAYERPLGRLGLAQEIAEVESLRSLAIFFRDHAPPDVSILTPWPGALAYLSRRQVLDLRGRATPPPGASRPVSWLDTPRIDLVRVLRQDVDYLVPTVGEVLTAPLIWRVVMGWIERYDVAPDREDRIKEIVSSLRAFELVSVPVPERSYDPEALAAEPALLLRKRDLGLSPQLSIRAEEGSFSVLAQHRAHMQVADLEVRFVDQSGDEWYMRPTGEWVRQRVHARTDLLLRPTGQRSIELVRFTVPPDLGTGSVHARLHNPGFLQEREFSAVGPPIELPIRG